MGDHAVNYFFNYVNNRMFSDNLTLLESIRTYMIDNNVPEQYKHMNCIQDAVNTISNTYNNQMILYQEFINNNIAHGLDDRIVRTLNDIIDVNNMIHHVNV
jgi:hypothetical protein